MLDGVRVLVAGAGLAGLAAARDLAAHGAEVTVVDARERPGGRVWTERGAFVGGQHAEAGGDLIDEGHTEIKALAADLGLTLKRILRGGWGYARCRASRTRLERWSAGSGWDRLAGRLAGLAEGYRLSERRWDSAVAADLARRSVRRWLDDVQAEPDLREVATGLRGFFLADPDELSLLALVDQFADSDGSWPGRTYRVEGGNDRIALRLAAQLGDRVHLSTELVAVSQRGRRVRAHVRHGRASSEIACDYLVVALPAPLVRRLPLSPTLPPFQREAYRQLRYGRATKTLLQFSQPFWRMRGRPRAFGSCLPIGAAWDASEEQRGRPGILALLAGGGASDATRALVARRGPRGLADALGWLGSGRAELVGSRQVVWERDPWARGGYAFFDPGFDPALREWLARPFGRLVFAGEHTSIRWQGYMNGAVESGRRAAAEIASLHRMRAQPGS